MGGRISRMGVGEFCCVLVYTRDSGIGAADLWWGWSLTSLLCLLGKGIRKPRIMFSRHVWKQVCSMDAERQKNSPVCFSARRDRVCCSGRWIPVRNHAVGCDGSFVLAHRHWRQAFGSSLLSRKLRFQKCSVFLFCTLCPIMCMEMKNKGKNQ